MAIDVVPEAPKKQQEEPKKVITPKLDISSVSREKVPSENTEPKLGLVRGY